MIKIKRINETTQADIRLPNEPFTLWGKLIPLYDGVQWSYRTEKYKACDIREMVFPDERYSFDNRKETCFFVGAYNDEEKCVGLAIFKRDWLKYLYLEDLKVNKAYRGQNVGQLLLDEGKKIASENGYHGIYTVAQDNNLSACLFYLKSGFEIGGFNTHEYHGTNQADKSNIYFYFKI